MSNRILIALSFMVMLSHIVLIHLILSNNFKGNVGLEGESFCNQTICSSYPKPEYKCYECVGKNTYKTRHSIYSVDAIFLLIGFIVVELFMWYRHLCNCCGFCRPRPIITDYQSV